MAEGQTEEVVLKALGVVGKFQIFNVWKHDIKKILPRVNAQAELWMYVDSDLSNNVTEFQRFKTNIQNLERAKRIFKVFLQVNDLEDELNKASQNDIYSVFGVQNRSKSELKTKLCGCSNLKEKLNQSVDKEKMWRQPHQKCDDIIRKKRPHSFQ